jgi:hypothetical protein
MVLLSPYSQEDNRVVAVAKFPGKIEQELTASLRSVGFRWNRYLKQWEGKVEYGEAEKLVVEQGGRIKCVDGADTR